MAEDYSVILIQQNDKLYLTRARHYIADNAISTLVYRPIGAVPASKNYYDFFC